MNFTLYDLATGRFLYQAYAENEDALTIPDGEAAVVGEFDGETHYAVAGEAVERPEMPITVDKTDIASDDIDTATLTGIPAGTKAVIPDVGTVLIDDGELQFTTDVVGNSVIRLSCFPYLRKNVVIHAG